MATDTYCGNIKCLKKFTNGQYLINLGSFLGEQTTLLLQPRIVAIGESDSSEHLFDRLFIPGIYRINLSKHFL